MHTTSTAANPALEKTSGWINGFIGVLIFSGSLPATRLAVLEFDPVFLTVVRAAIAGALAVGLLLLFKQPRPSRHQWLSLVIVALGVVLGFPLLTALALQHVTSAHSIVFVGLLPLATAMFGVLRGGERPRPVFWIFSVLGSALVVGFALSQGLSASPIGDLLMLAAILACGLGYAEGAKLSRSLGGWQVICWALVISLPVLGPIVALRAATYGLSAGPAAWASFAYISVFSMFLGMFVWYRGLAQGGIARIGQLQLAQPVLTLIWSALLLGEQVTLGMGVASLAVVASVAATQRARVTRAA